MAGLNGTNSGRVKFMNNNSVGKIQRPGGGGAYTLKNKSLARVTQKTDSTQLYSSGVRSRPQTSGNNTVFFSSREDPGADLSSNATTAG